MNNTNDITSAGLIHSLQDMYSDNTRLIRQLREDNIEIRNLILEEYNRSQNSRRSIYGNRNTRRNYVNFPVNEPSLFSPYFNTPPSTRRRNDTPASFFDRVPLPPSTSQMNLAILRTNFNNIIDPLNNSCPITLDNFNEDDNVALIKYCGHIFNPTDLLNWFTTENRCPVCRYDIRNYEPGTNNYTLHDNDNIAVFNRPISQSELNVDISSNLNDPIIDNNSNNNNNNTFSTETIRQIDNMLLQLLNNPSTTSIPSRTTDASGNYIISYSLN